MSQDARESVAIVLPVHNRKDVTINFLRRLQDVPINGCEKQIIVVDDGSSDGTAEAIEDQFPSVTILKGDGNLWWTGAVNTGIQNALKKKVDYVLIMNDDVDFEMDFANVLINGSKAESACIMGATTLYAERNRKVIWKAGMRETAALHPRFENVFQNQEWTLALPELIEVDSVSGRAMLVPAGIFEKVGLFEQRRFPHGGAVLEFCLRAKRNGSHVCVSTRSLIYSEPGKSKDLFVFLNTASRWQFVKSCLDLRYSWHLRTSFHIATCYRDFVPGMVGFLWHLSAILKWLLLKTLLPHRLLAYFLSKRSRVGLV